MNNKSRNMHAPPLFMQPNPSCLTRIVRCLHCRSLLRRAMFSPVSCFAKKPIGRTPLHSSPAFNLYTNAKLKLSLRTRLARHAHARFMHFLWWRSGKDIARAPIENAHKVPHLLVEFRSPLIKIGGSRQGHLGSS